MGPLADYVEAVEAAVNRARKTVRQRVWDLAGEHSPTAGISAERPLVIDVDATLVNVHSEKVGGGPDLQEGVRLPPPDRMVGLSSFLCKRFTGMG